MDFNEERCRNHSEMIRELKHDIWGNGDEGLKVRFTRVETKVKIMLGLELTLLAGMASLLFKAFVG